MCWMLKNKLEYWMYYKMRWYNRQNNFLNDKKVIFMQTRMYIAKVNIS